MIDVRIWNNFEYSLYGRQFLCFVFYKSWFLLLKERMRHKDQNTYIKYVFLLYIDS